MAKKKTARRRAATSKKSAQKRTPGRKKAGRRKTGTPSSALSGMSLGELEREIGRRQQKARTLERRRNRLATQLEEIDAELAEIGALGGISVGGVRKRPKNDMNLAEALAKTLNGKTMGVTEVSEAVQRDGYRTSAANFRTIVNQTLIKDKRFKKITRGQYTTK